MSAPAPARKALAGFLSEFSPGIQGLSEHVLPALIARMPGAQRLVFNNYNALVIAFSPTARTADCLLSIALYPGWINLFFAHGASLPDPERLLKGSGKAIRHVVLKRAADFDAAPVQALLKAALVGRPELLDPTAPGELVIKPGSPAPRPRTPAPKRS